MSVALGALATDAPIPTGRTTYGIRCPGGGLIARPASGNFYCFGAGSTNLCEIAVAAKPYRFWWRVGATKIEYMAGAWERFDWQLQLLNTNYAYGNDLNGIGVYQQTLGSEGTGHSDPWNGCGIEGLFYCEANSNYWCRLLTAGGGGYYYQHPVHFNMWAYTIGEGVY